ncbi:uncharacterized protein LOC102432416 isoform X2 [Myotis lucifugus]|uniref:uncharacterized protein LOC102432416 isoform X2 n=1 Tax=Myotis lucifugus TaxID=59463 RepID=UPI000CCBE90C|nr:uncharacterized protein LOC102432416 isoform X2 [Myotis lucifugus]
MTLREWRCRGPVDTGCRPPQPRVCMSLKHLPRLSAGLGALVRGCRDRRVWLLRRCLSAGPGRRHRFWWMAGCLFAAVVGALVILCVRKPGDGGRRAACCCPHAGPVSTGRHYRRDSPESSVSLVASPETPDADAPVPTTGAPHLPEDRLDEASETPILPGTPESPAGGGPRLEAEAGDEARPQAGHHGLTLLHPPTPWPEGPEGSCGHKGATCCR